MIPGDCIIDGLEHIAVVDVRVCLILGQELDKTNPTLGSCYHQGSAEGEEERGRRERDKLYTNIFGIVILYTSEVFNCTCRMLTNYRKVTNIFFESSTSRKKFVLHIFLSCHDYNA